MNHHGIVRWCFRSTRVLFFAGLAACSTHQQTARTAGSPSDAAVRASLAKAGANAPEIERFLAASENGSDPQKRTASRWLVANMLGHGFVYYTLQDAQGNDIAFDIDDYKTLDEAQLALDALEKKHGPVDFKMRRFDADLEHATCAFLTQNLEQAFSTWRTDPWMRDVQFEVFLECVLPYRASNEPLCPGWRTAARARIAPSLAKLGAAPTLAAVTQAAIDAGHAWVPFSDRYYMHPTDQSYDDMCRTKLGRCEDITNMITFAARASGAMVASDFTPWWANRDNNHAWEVAVDAEGRGAAGLSNRAAKVYRKTFSAQPGALGTVKAEADKVPGSLKLRTLRDVTSQYVPVTDVTVELIHPEGELPSKFVYLAVFNGGEWRPIHWAMPSAGRATFTAMGRGILYLPVWSNDTTVKPAGAPFVLQDDGRVAALPNGTSAAKSLSLEAATTIPDTPDADTRRTKPRVKVEPGKECELLVWCTPGEWKSLGKRIPTADSPAVFDAVPAGALLWLRSADGRALERPFTLGERGQVFW